MGRCSRATARSSAAPAPALQPVVHTTMPELPEVEHAARLLRMAVQGRRLERVEPLHPALQRRMGDSHLRLAGRPILGVERRGKHQLVRLGASEGDGEGLTLHVHFRMAGDWLVLPDDATPLPRHARAVLTLDDTSRVVLVDPRALATLALLPADALPPGLGPDATDPDFTPEHLAAALRGRRAPIKPLLLDQRIVAGVGNIYATEALWLARIDPRTPAARLGRIRVTRLVAAIRQALDDGARVAARYADGTPDDAFAVYGRAGDPCRRCGSPIRRLVQAGRSTYYCSRCQR